MSIVTPQKMVGFLRIFQQQNCPLCCIVAAELCTSPALKFLVRLTVDKGSLLMMAAKARAESILRQISSPPAEDKVSAISKVVEKNGDDIVC